MAGPEFILLFRTADYTRPHLFIQRSPSHAPLRAALLSFFPDFAEAAPKKTEESKETKVDESAEEVYFDEEEEEGLEGAGEFVFVVDRSGSMSGSSMKMAVKAAKLFVKSLPACSRFNVVSFGSGYKAMFPRSVEYSKDNVRKAMNELDGFSADMGGTEILAPLSAIYKWEQNQAFPVNIFLLTDGEVDSPGAVVALIRRNASRARCHSFGIGSGVSRELVKGAAIAGKGTYQFIASTTDHMNAKVISSLSHAVRPALVDLRAVWPAPPALQGPLSSVFHAERCVLRAVLPASSSNEVVLRCIDTQTQK